LSTLDNVTKKRPVQIDLSSELIAKIEKFAEAETLTRTAWIRRLLHNTVKAAADQKTDR
jgi:predicted DNA binding CopG/RHH family protein